MAQIDAQIVTSYPFTVYSKASSSSTWSTSYANQGYIASNGDRAMFYMTFTVPEGATDPKSLTLHHTVQLGIKETLYSTDNIIFGYSLYNASDFNITDHLTSGSPFDGITELTAWTFTFNLFNYTVSTTSSITNLNINFTDSSGNATNYNDVTFDIDYLVNDDQWPSTGILTAGQTYVLLIAPISTTLNSQYYMYFGNSSDFSSFSLYFLTDTHKIWFEGGNTSTYFCETYFTDKSGNIAMKTSATPTNVISTTDSNFVITGSGGDTNTSLTATKTTTAYKDFLGWSLSSTATTATWANSSSVIANFTDDTTVYAVWSSQKTSYSYKNNKLSQLSIPTKASTTNYVDIGIIMRGGYIFTPTDGDTMSIPITLSYEFSNWADSSGTELVTSTKTFTSATTVYAVYDVTSDETIAGIPSPKKEGYTFLGWATSESATTPADTSTPIMGPITLYALWEDNSSVGLYLYTGGQWLPVYCD